MKNIDLSTDKKDNIFYITHSGELLIWLVIILIIVAVSTITYVSNTQKDNDYNIFMSVVDGLIVGSPVRIMGIEVGHVTKIKPTNGYNNYNSNYFSKTAPWEEEVTSFEYLFR